MEKPSKVVPALVGGLTLGVLSSIPLVNLGNCCCLWILLGGVIAAYMLVKRSPVMPIQTGDGAGVGALAGLIGSLVYLGLGLPISLFMPQNALHGVFERLRDLAQDPQSKQQLEEMLRQMQHQGDLGQRLGGALFFWLVASVVATGFACLGGILGVAMFEKRKGFPPPTAYPSTWPPPPPPPPPGPARPY
jgi:hypothetical protein